jgi:hypothetical protein
LNACKARAICERRTFNACNAVGETIIFNTLGDYHTAGVLVGILARKTTSVCNLDLFVCLAE